MTHTGPIPPLPKGTAVVSGDLLNPHRRSMPVIPLGKRLTVGGYSVVGGKRAFHFVVRSDRQIEEKTSAEQTVTEASLDPTQPATTLLFDSDKALDLLIEQLQNLRAINPQEEEK